MEKAGQTQYISEAGTYDLSKILQIMPENLRKNVVSDSDDGKALNKPAQAIKIFISYAHEDEEHTENLVKRLKVMNLQYLQLQWWHDRKLMSGKWERQILSELEKADIVLLLISIDFMASDYCFKVETEKALLKYRNKGHLVIPIIVRETPSWNKHEIGQLQALPKDAKPLDEWENSDRFWGDVQRGLERELERLVVSRNGE